jgi:hypothetical protein
MSKYDNPQILEVTLSDLRHSLGDDFGRFSNGVLSENGLSIRQYDKLSRVAISIEDEMLQKAALKMLDDSAIRRARAASSTGSFFKKILAAFALITVLSFSFSAPIMANTSAAAEEWYITAVGYVEAALEWMQVVKEGFDTLNKGVEYMTKVMDNQLGSLFDLQTEQYNKQMAAQGTATESLLTQMENQQKAWARLSSRPGSNVCVDGALYGGWLGLQQEIEATTSGSTNGGGVNNTIEGEPPVPEITDAGALVAPKNIVADMAVAEQKLRNSTSVGNINQREALLTVSALSDATDAANDAIEWNHNSSRLQSELGAGGTSTPDLSKLLVKRLEDVLDDPDPAGGQAAVSDNRLKVLAQSSLNLMRQQGWDKSMSMDDYYEFLVLRYMTAGYGEFLNSGGPGVEPLLRELIGISISMLQFQLESQKTAKKTLEVMARNVMAESVMPERQDAMNQAKQQHRQTR